MVMSTYPSTVLMPKMEKPYPLILDFLAHRFPGIDTDTWKLRIQSGKVLTEEGEKVPLDMLCTPLKRLHYFREVSKEEVIPFTETILFCNTELLVACKPHFLPVTPGGPYVNQCLLHRLKEKADNPHLSPINRIDRETAGLVLFSMNPKTRGRYQELFMQGKVEKTYEAVTQYSHDPEKHTWTVENRLVRGTPWFRMKKALGKPNAISEISLMQTRGNRGIFKLKPVTGKKHQLRLHLAGSGFPILNDRYYPTLLPEKNNDYSAPLQLLAGRLQFRDPISGRQMCYESQRQLSCNPR